MKKFHIEKNKKNQSCLNLFQPKRIISFQPSKSSPSIKDQFAPIPDNMCANITYDVSKQREPKAPQLLTTHESKFFFVGKISRKMNKKLSSGYGLRPVANLTLSTG